jgi:hypothetical protein
MRMGLHRCPELPSVGATVKDEADDDSTVFKLVTINPSVSVNISVHVFNLYTSLYDAMSRVSLLG